MEEQWSDGDIERLIQPIRDFIASKDDWTSEFLYSMAEKLSELVIRVDDKALQRAEDEKSAKS